MLVESKLSYRFLLPNRCSEQQVGALHSAYALWKSVWAETFHELDGATELYADEFTRQHAIGALFCGRECIGLSGFRWVQLSSPFTRQDSYFRAWPDQVFAQVAAKGTRACVGSNLTVAPHWRSRPGLRVKEVLLALAVEGFMASEADLMVGTLRNDKRMNEVAYALGATALHRGARFHNCPVDLVAFYRDRVESVRPSEPARSFMSLVQMESNNGIEHASRELEHAWYGN